MIETGIEQIPGAIANRILDKFFGFPRHSGSKIDVHRLFYDDTFIGFAATELYDKVAIIHMYVYPEYRTAKWLRGVIWIFQNVVAPLLKSRGFSQVIANCDEEDTVTARFLKAAGFNIRRVMLADYPL